MQRLPLLRASVLALLTLLRLEAALPDFDFSRNPSTLDWQPAHDIAFLPSSTHGMEAVIHGPDPFLVSPPIHPAGARELLVEIRLRSKAGGFAQLFWLDPSASEANSVHFACRSNEWTDACLAIPPTRGEIRLRIDPPGTNGPVQLAWVRLSPMDSRGIHHAVAGPDSIQLHLTNVAGPFRMLEVQPHQTLSRIAADPPALPLESQGESTVSVTRMVPEDGGKRDRLLSGFVLFEPHPVHGWRPAGPVRHVGDVGRASPPGALPPRPSSKKGLQVQMVEDAVALGVRHAALNVNLAALMDTQGQSDSYEWAVGGKTHRFNRAAVDAIPVKPLSDSGAAVSLILLAYASGDPARDRVWLHPGYDRRAPNRLGAFNHVTEDGARWLQAAVEFLCHRFSRQDNPHGRISHLIVGNEVTAHWHWANMGEVPPSIFIEDYVQTVRLVNAAAARVAPGIRVHVSLDHHWNLTYGNAPLRAIPGRRLVDEFARVARLGGDFSWHMAYHPYPEDLFRPATWKDKTALPVAETPRITFKNLEVLTSYLARPELTWRGSQRRVLLSEQGFHSDGTPRGEELQAAAYAYAWHKVDSLEGIDAFILHRHVDHRDEGGLNLGLWRRREGSVADPASPKPIREVFLRADTPSRDDAFAFALPIIGITNWAQVRVPAGSAVVRDSASHLPPR